MVNPKNKRGGHKAAVNIILQRLNDLLKRTPLDLVVIENHLREINRQKLKVLEFDDEIQDSLDDSAIADDILESSDWVMNLEMSLKPAEDVLNQKNSKVSGTNSTDGKMNGIKLPTLNLPCFQGDATEWSHFWDMFQSSVHNRNDLSGAHKFRYLMGQLKDEPLRLLDGFSMNDANYIEAIKLLEETFGDPNIIIQAHLNALFDLKSPGSTAEELSKFRSSFECHIRALKMLNTKIEEGGFIIASLLHRKLPLKIRNNINRAARQNHWDLDKFRVAINEEIKHLQAVQPQDENQLIDKTKQKHKDFGKKFGHKSFTEGRFVDKTTIGSFHVSSQKGQSFEKSVVCRFCFEPHYHSDCANYNNSSARQERAKDLNLCLRCLCNNHKTADCRGKTTCKICGGKHNYALCNRSGSVEKNQKKGDPVQDNKTTILSSISTKPKDEMPGIALPTALAGIKGPYNQRQITVLFDQGSQRSFILANLAQEMKLSIVGKINLTIEGFLAVEQQRNYSVVEFEVLGEDNSTILHAICVEKLPAKVNMIGIKAVAESIEKSGHCLTSERFVEDCVRNISLLIGGDNYYKFVSGFEVIDKSLALLNSSLGLMLSGDLNSKIISCNMNGNSEATVLLVAEESDHHGEICCDMQRLWSLDSIGITTNELTIEEKNVFESFKKSLLFENGHYKAKLPWKNSHPLLRSNYGLAYGRLIGVLKKLRRDGNLDHYDKVIKEQLKRGFIEEVNSNEIPSATSKIHYIPHQPVKKESTTTPLRVVYDCSSGKPSLNECLYSGPCMIEEMTSVLLRFRMNKFACISDIEKAYFMIHLYDDDKESTRFLWPRDPEDESSDIVTYRFKVVLFGATCSQFLLSAAVQYHLSLHAKSLSERICKNLYVDNLQGMSEDEDELIDFYHKVKEIFGSAGLILREWMTNSPELKKIILLKGDGPKKETIETKILGMLWNIDHDVLSYPKKDLGEKINSKRDSQICF